MTGLLVAKNQNNNSISSMKTRDLVLVAIFVSLSVISAFLKIPLPGLPLTFQLATAIASGIFLGKVLGPASQGIYLVLGLIGLPVFAKGGGPMYVLQPSFGYLLALPLSSFLTGWLWDKQGWKKIISVAAGVIVAFVIGIAYTYICTYFFLGNQKAIADILSITLLVLFAKDIVLGYIIYIIGSVLSPYYGRNRQ